MRSLFGALVLLTVVACGKKTEPVPAVPVVVEPPKLEAVKEEVKPVVVSPQVALPAGDAGVVSVPETK